MTDRLLVVDDPAEIGRHYLADERPPHDDRPWVSMGMVQSLDGATAIDGRSSALGGEPDLAVFRAHRAVADVILVGAGTARVERYGAAALPDDLVEWRSGRGMTAQPRIALVSRSLALDMTESLAGSRPIVLTGESAPRDRVAALESDTDLIVAGDDGVDPHRAMQALAALGVRVVALEGGPTLNGDMLAAGLIDELCVTISPSVVGGPSQRIVAGPETAVDARPDRVILSRGHLLTRYLVG